MSCLIQDSFRFFSGCDRACFFFLSRFCLFCFTVMSRDICEMDHQYEKLEKIGEGESLVFAITSCVGLECFDYPFFLTVLFLTRDVREGVQGEGEEHGEASRSQGDACV